ncbi:Alcohol dehydrogenase [Cladobotryum mycophilum]|uniref:Alcohol dehydrogenase n=1 Tax=Cladobotryum mycophilum TaxID=491253 RepID=A0ABR0SP80_9HYPO
MDFEIPSHMKALQLVKYNDYYHLHHHVPVPVPKQGQVLVRVCAAGFCHSDLQVHDGTYRSPLPIIPSHETAGIIAALGANVSGDWKVGDRVGVLNIRNPCGTCSGCKWSSATLKELDARFCENKVMAGIKKADGGFAEYTLAEDYTLVLLPDSVSFEQAAPLTCAGATVWNAIQQTGLAKGQSIGIIGIGGLGVLGVQFAKALGYRVVAVDNRDIGLRLASEVPSRLRPDLIVDYNSPDAISQISLFTDDLGLNAAVVCTDNIEASDWTLNRLQPRGTCVVLGLPESGFRFEAFNLVFREIVVKGSLLSSVAEANRMLQVVAEHGVRSHLTMLPLEQGEMIPERAAGHEFAGRLVVTMH